MEEIGMKKIMVIALIVLLSIGMVGCNLGRSEKNTDPSKQPNNVISEEAENEENEEVVEEVKEEVEEPEEAEQKAETEKEQSEKKQSDKGTETAKEKNPPKSTDKQPDKKEPVKEQPKEDPPKKQPKEEEKPKEESPKEEEKPKEEETAPPKEEVVVVDFLKLLGFKVGYSGLSNSQIAKINQEQLESPSDGMFDDTAARIVMVRNGYKDYGAGTFNWDYRNTNNRSKYLKYRGGRVYYQPEKYGAAMSYSEVYNKIHQVIKDNKLIIQGSFSYDPSHVYAHPSKEGFWITGTMKIKYTSDSGAKLKGMEPNKWYSRRFNIVLFYPTLHPSDNWSLWFPKSEGINLLVSREYVEGGF